MNTVPSEMHKGNKTEKNGTGTSGLPAWLVAHLVADGVMTGERVTMRAKLFRCKLCGVFTLRAMDDHFAARVATLDYYATTTVGEMWATFYRPDALRYGIDASGRLVGPRDVACMKASNADQIDVHVEHDCNAPPMPVSPRWLQRQQRRTRDYDNIPF